MNDSTPLDTIHDEPLEARIVAWVLGEASPFEAAELERLSEDRPELLVFRHRMRALHGLLTEAESAEPDNSWKLPEEKRKVLDEIFGEEKIVPLVSEKDARIRRSGRRALLAIAACVMLTLFTIPFLHKEFESEAIIEIKPRSVGISPLQSNEASGSLFTPQFFGTEFEKIKSRNSLSKVVDNLELTNRWGVDKETALQTLKGIIKTENVPGTDLISIRVRNANQEDAQDITAEVARAYKEYRTEVESRDTDRQLAELNKAVRDQEDKVEERRKVLATIVRTKGIIYKGQDSFYGSSEVNEDLGSQSAQETVDQLRQEKTQLEGQINGLLKYDSDNLVQYAGGLNVPDNVIKNIYPQYQAKNRALNNLKNQGLGEDHPSVKAAKEQVKGMKDQMDEGVVNLRATMQAQLNMAVDRLKSVETRTADTRENAIKRGLDAQDYVDAKRDFETDQQLLQQMKLKQVAETISNKMPNDSIEVHDDPQITTRLAFRSPFESSTSEALSGFHHADVATREMTAAEPDLAPTTPAAPALPEMAMRDARARAVPPARGTTSSSLLSNIAGGKEDSKATAAREPAPAEFAMKLGSEGLKNSENETGTGGGSGRASGDFGLADRAESKNVAPSAPAEMAAATGEEVRYKIDDPIAEASKDAIASSSLTKEMDDGKKNTRDRAGLSDGVERSRKFMFFSEYEPPASSLPAAPKQPMADEVDGSIRSNFAPKGEHAGNVDEVRRELEDLTVNESKKQTQSKQWQETQKKIQVLGKAKVLPTKKPPLESIEEISATEEPYSTFSLNISDASFQIAKAALEKGERPDPAAIKVEQFYNAVDYGDPASAPNEPVAATIEQAAHPIIPGRNLVRVSLKTAAAGRGASQPLRLTLLVDQSGSMVREDRRTAMTNALKQLGGLLTPNDHITVVGFSRESHLLADNWTGDKAGQLGDLINQTASEGGTNLEQAINLGEQMAARPHAAGEQNRIVLFTDGAANLGNANPERLAERVKSLRQKGIAFDIAGIGADGVNDRLLSELARNGNGRYYVVGDSKNESFARQLAGAFRPAAENVKVQVHFNPDRVGRYKLIGFEKDRLNTEDFRNDAVDAAELAAEEAGVAIYQVETLPQGSGEIGEVNVRFRDTAKGEMVERKWTMPFESTTQVFDRATPSMQLAGLSMLAAEKLKGGPLADAIDFRQLSESQSLVKQFYGSSLRVADMLHVIDLLK